jgi:hypothetical protein
MKQFMEVIGCSTGTGVENALGAEESAIPVRRLSGLGDWPLWPDNRQVAASKASAGLAECSGQWLSIYPMAALGRVLTVTLNFFPVSRMTAIGRYA